MARPCDDHQVINCGLCAPYLRQEALDSAVEMARVQAFAEAARIIETMAGKVQDADVKAALTEVAFAVRSCPLGGVCSKCGDRVVVLYAEGDCAQCMEKRHAEVNSRLFAEMCAQDA